MPDLDSILDQIDRLDQEATKGPWTSIGNDCGGKVYEPSGYPLPGCTSCGENEATYEGQDAEFIALARTALPQLAKALRAVIESCEETIRSVDKNLLPDERDHANRDHADMILDAITDAMKADHAG